MIRETLKYKTLKSVAHNFTHSFVSFNNYVDDGFVIDDLRQLVREANGERVSIVWLPVQAQSPSLTPRILKSIEYYKADLPRFVLASGSEISSIREFRSEIFLKPNKQIAVEGYLVDHRGRVYITPVYDF